MHFEGLGTRVSACHDLLTATLLLASFLDSLNCELSVLVISCGSLHHIPLYLLLDSFLRICPVSILAFIDDLLLYLDVRFQMA